MSTTEIEDAPTAPGTTPDTQSNGLVPAQKAVDSESTSQAVVKKVKKRRPARPQIDPSLLRKGDELPPQTGTIFNIWYNKWSGGDYQDPIFSKTHAIGRCNVAKDSGYTRADKATGSFFCLFFARGICPKGHECEYLHRLPAIHDHFNPNVDCFGRDKFSDYRDDMGGVGSFLRQNRTLYIGRVNVNDDVEEVVARHFQEWGDVERIRVLNTRGVAFVTYASETNAQFAKEAMAHQSLDSNEILNVRWATQDPNPQSAARDKRKMEEQAAEAIRKALPAEFVAELENRDPEAKRRKKIEANFGLEGYEAPDAVWYNREASGISQPKTIEASAAQMLPVQQENGIFGNSTLAALQSLSSHSRVGVQAVKAQTSGPLVAYGSDDDDD